MLGVVGQTLVVAVSQLVDMPDRDTGARDEGITSLLLAVLEEVVFGVHTRFDDAIKLVEAGLAKRGGQGGLDVFPP